MALVLREARAEDLPAICVLGQEANLLHHEAWPQVFAPPSDPSRDAPHWQQSIAKPDAVTFVAEQSGQVIAFITVSLVTESNPLLQSVLVARIGSVCVSAQFRRHGIGRSLMARTEQWAHERGARDIRLNVWAFNAEALRFYEGLGYAVRSHLLGKVLSRAA
jgi:ribosomal protein S18 acetylase RimI-like enzyme